MTVDTVNTTDPSLSYLQQLNILDTALDKLEELQQKYSGQTVGLPEVADELETMLASMDLPKLTVPLKSLSLDTLLDAIGHEDRRANAKSAVDKINKDGDAIKAESEKKLEQIKTRLEELKAKETEGIFGKIFGAITAVFSAIATAFTIVAAAVTLNPVIIAAAVFLTISVVDSIASLASDGKVSIAGGVSALCEKLGMDPETAKWVGFGAQMAVMVTTVALSFGAAGVSQSPAVLEKLAKLGDMANLVSKTSTVANIGSGVANIGSGTVKICEAVTTYKIAQTKITDLELEMILEKLRESIKRSQEFVEAEMQAANALLGKVQDIAEQSRATTTAILTETPA